MSTNDWSISIDNLNGETIYKVPGTLKEGSVYLKDLENCTVYLLDVTTMVEIINVKNCKIFIGPVDGAVLAENVDACKITVAAQMFQAKNVSHTSINLYCGNKPTFTACSDIILGPWNGEYHDFKKHLAAANLNFNKNEWDKAQDIDETSHEEASFTLVNEVQTWEVTYTPSDTQQSDLHDSYNNSTWVSEASNNLADLQMKDPVDHPKSIAIQNEIHARQQKQEAKEVEVKAELAQNAIAFKKFYEERNQRIENKAKLNRQNHSASPTTVEGDTHWEKTLNLVDFTFSRPNGTDLTRFKNVLFAAKTKKVTV